MTLIPLNRHPTTRQLRLSAYAWSAALWAGAWFALSHGRPIASAALATAGAVTAVLGWQAPARLRPLYVGASYLAYPVAVVLSYLLLAAVYYIVVTPIGCLMRLAGHDPLRRRINRQADSYWTPLADRDELEQYFRQY